MPVLLVGPSGAGKTTVWQTVMASLAKEALDIAQASKLDDEGLQVGVVGGGCSHRRVMLLASGAV